MGFLEGRGRLDPPARVLKKTYQWAGWLPGALLGLRVAPTPPDTPGLSEIDIKSSFSEPFPGRGGVNRPHPQHPRSQEAAGTQNQRTLCYTIVLPGRKSVFRAGFRPDSSRESLKIDPPAGLRLAGGPI